MLTLPTSVCHFIYKDLDLGQQYKRADIRNFSNEIVLLGNSDSFQLQISHTNEDGCYISREMGAKLKYCTSRDLGPAPV